MEFSCKQINTMFAVSVSYQNISGFDKKQNDLSGPISENRISENSEYVRPKMRETLSFLFHKPAGLLHLSG